MNKNIYTPGNIIHVKYWQSYDLVLSYDEPGINGCSWASWSVTVVECDKNGEPYGQIRTHCTDPGPDTIVGFNDRHREIYKRLQNDPIPEPRSIFDTHDKDVCCPICSDPEGDVNDCPNGCGCHGVTDEELANDVFTPSVDPFLID